MATPLGRLPVWMRQSTLVPAAFRMLSLPVAGSASLARNTWLPPRLTIRNVSPVEVGIDGHDVVAERPVETGGRRGGLHGDLQFRLTFSPTATSARAVGVHGVDERLHVHVEYLRRLRLGADGRQIQTVAANQRRQELVGEHPLRVVRV